MKKLLLFFVICCLTTACEEENIDCGCTNIDVGILMSVLDENGQDLLDPANAESYDFNTINVFEVVDGERIPVYQSNLDSPKGIFLSEPQGSYTHYFLDLSFSTSSDEQYNTRIIQWNENEEDEFKVEFNRGDNFLLIKKVWINQELKWDVEDASGDRYFTLVK